MSNTPYNRHWTIVVSNFLDRWNRRITKQGRGAVHFDVQPDRKFYVRHVRETYKINNRVYKGTVTGGRHEIRFGRYRLIRMITKDHRSDLVRVDGKTPTKETSGPEVQ